MQNKHDFAFDDYANSLKLSSSVNEEKAARLGRLSLYNRTIDSRYLWEDFEKDYEWLRDHTEGYGRGEVIFTYINSWDNLSVEGLSAGEEMVSLVDEAINLGFNNSEMYYFRSIGNKAASNFGIALHDIDKAISITENIERKVVYLCHRAELLANMKDFQEVYKTLEEAKRLDKSILKSHLYFDLYKIDIDLLYLFGLDKKFSGDGPVVDEPIVSMLKLSLIWNGRRVTGYRKDKAGNIIKVKTELDDIVNQYPGIVSSLMRLLSEEERKVFNNVNAEYIFKLRIPSVMEQINRKADITITIPSEDEE